MPTYAHIQTDQTDAWYRVLQFTDLENPTIAHETYAYLDDLADMHRTALMQRLWNLPDLATNMLADMKHPQETLEEKGTLYVNKVGGFHPDPAEQEIVEVVECPQRPRAEGEGFTGWLTSEGNFFESIYGTHDQIAWNNNLADDEGAICLACATSPITNEMTDLVTKGLKAPTEKQLQWFATYEKQLSPNQQAELKTWKGKTNETTC